MDSADKFVLLDQTVTRERLLRFGFSFNEKTNCFEKDYHMDDCGNYTSTFEVKNDNFYHIITYHTGGNLGMPIIFNIHNMYDLIRFYENYCSKNPITKIPEK